MEQPIERRNIDKQIVGQNAIKGAHIRCAHSTHRQKKGDRYWNSQVNGEGKTEGLYLDFARKFREHIKDPGCDGVKEKDVKNKHCGGPNVTSIKMVGMIREQRIHLEKHNLQFCICKY